MWNREHRTRQARSYVLLNFEKVENTTARFFDELEQLRIYLTSSEPAVCSIHLMAPKDHRETLSAFQAMGIEVTPIVASAQFDRIPKKVCEKLTDPLRNLLATALDQDADCVITADAGILSYVEEFNEAWSAADLKRLLLRYSETFARGHDVPWAFCAQGLV